MMHFESRLQFLIRKQINNLISGEKTMKHFNKLSCTQLHIYCVDFVRLQFAILMVLVIVIWLVGVYLNALSKISH